MLTSGSSHQRRSLFNTYSYAYACVASEDRRFASFLTISETSDYCFKPAIDLKGNILYCGRNGLDFFT